MLVLVGPVFPAAGQAERFDGNGLQRRIASDVREGVDGLAALPDVLVVRQGASVYGLDPFNLQQLWVFKGNVPEGDPLLVGGRLFLFDSVVRTSTSGGGGGAFSGGGSRTTRTTYYRIVELDPGTGHARWQRESDSTPPRVLAGCGRAAFLFPEKDLVRPKFTAFLISREDPPSRVHLRGQLGTDLASAIEFERIWLAGNHLLAWVPELRLLAAVPLAPEARAWRRPFDADVIDAAGCGDQQVLTTSAGSLVGMDARTGKSLWQVARPTDRSALLFPAGESVAMPADGRPAWLDPLDGSLRPLPLAASLEGVQGLLQDGNGRSVLFAGSRLAVYDFASGAGEWEYDAGEPIARMAAAESYVALITESGKVEVLGQSRPRSAAKAPPPDAGALDLTVDPDHAFVWLDGSFLGPGGQRIDSLSPGPHELRLVHPDRKRRDTSVEILPGQVSELSFVMSSRGQGPVLIDSNPAGASVTIDGEPAGTTPLPPRSGVPDGQVLDVILRKQGYRDVREPLAVREDGAELSAELELAPLLGGAFAGGGRAAAGPIRGWRRDDIRAGQVVGDPYRPDEGDSFLRGAVVVELGPRRSRLFGRYVGTSLEETSEWEAGLWLALDRGLRVEVGASYLNLDIGEGTSDPPRRCNEEGRGCTPDRNAPLEEWSHPIPGVFVRNEAPTYWIGRVRFRPQAGMFLDLGVGRLEGARLRGTAMVEDAAGHLIRDEARAYDFRARRGTLLEARLLVALGTFRVWKLFPSTALEIHYRDRRTDFGAVDETTRELTFGVGILGFWSDAWKQ